MAQSLRIKNKKIGLASRLIFQTWSINPITRSIKITQAKTNGNVDKLSPFDAISFCKHGHLQEALIIFHLTGKIINPYNYAFLLHYCTKKRVISGGKLIHSHMNERVITQDVFWWTILITTNTVHEL